MPPVPPSLAVSGRCSLCGLAVPYTAVSERALGAKGLSLCPGCKLGADRTSVEVGPGIKDDDSSRRPSSVVEMKGGGKERLWHCEHCGVGFVSGVPERGGLCICPICDGEIGVVGAERVGVGKGGVSRFSESEDGVSRGGSRCVSKSTVELERARGASPVSPLGEGRFDGVSRRSERFESRGVSEVSAESWEEGASETDTVIPGIDTRRPGLVGPNLHLVYEEGGRVPSISSSVTTAIDLNLPRTPPPRVSSKVGFIRSKTQERQEAQQEMPQKYRFAASSIYPTDETEKDCYTSDKPLPAVSRNSSSLPSAEREAVANMPPLSKSNRDSGIWPVFRARGSDMELTPDESAAVANMPPMGDESDRNSGIWPSNELRATLPLQRRSSFYGFVSPPPGNFF